MTIDRWLPAGPATWKPGRYQLRQCACGRLFRPAMWLHRLQAGDRP